MTKPKIGDAFNPHKMFRGVFVPLWLAERAELSPGAKLTYATLAFHAGKDGKCFPAYQTIAREIGVHRRQAFTNIKALETCGLIVSDAKPGHSSSYRFLWHVWMDAGPVQLNARVPMQDNAQGGAIKCTGGMQDNAHIKDKEETNQEIYFCKEGEPSQTQKFSFGENGDAVSGVVPGNLTISNRELSRVYIEAGPNLPELLSDASAYKAAGRWEYPSDVTGLLFWCARIQKNPKLLGWCPEHAENKRAVRALRVAGYVGVRNKDDDSRHFVKGQKRFFCNYHGFVIGAEDEVEHITSQLTQERQSF